MTGRIIQGIGSFYTVESEGQRYVCKARGRFRKQRISPLVGDFVEFQPADREDGEGFIEEILPRNSELLRPPVANVDVIFVTVAASSPEPDLLLVDRLLVRAHRAGIEAKIIVNKTDLNGGMAEEIARQYGSAGYEVFRVSAKQGVGLDALKAAAQGKTIAFAGQSAVGKSSLLNALCPGLSLETGSVSRIERGRHTTRKAQLIPMQGGYLADTPGFSLLELDTMEPELLAECYPEFAPYEGKCRFLGCQHLNEPDCAVKDAAQQGAVSRERLERYAVLHQELKEKWGKRYD
ncbi:MAG: ribosome small subunit-dependent GTPase A [Candidatus Spyradocola sp.]|nr:ribosome small subunit-dependent GTPase A [Candidatus Spyradocola sp.]